MKKIKILSRRITGSNQIKGKWKFLTCLNQRGDMTWCSGMAITPTTFPHHFAIEKDERGFIMMESGDILFFGFTRKELLSESPVKGFVKNGEEYWYGVEMKTLAQFLVAKILLLEFIPWDRCGDGFLLVEGRLLKTLYLVKDGRPLCKVRARKTDGIFPDMNEDHCLRSETFYALIAPLGFGPAHRVVEAY